MISVDICPLCQKSLTFKQINFEEALLICEDLKCPYPTGQECVVVKRKLEDIGLKVAVKNDPDQFETSSDTFKNLDKEIDDFMNKLLQGDSGQEDDKINSLRTELDNIGLEFTSCQEDKSRQNETNNVYLPFLETDTSTKENEENFIDFFTEF